MKKFQEEASDSVVRYEMTKALNKYCEMSIEEQDAYIKDHKKTHLLPAFWRYIGELTYSLGINSRDSGFKQ